MVLNIFPNIDKMYYNVGGMRCLMLVPVNWCQVVQAPWHVFSLCENRDKTDFVYRMLSRVIFPFFDP